MMVRMRFWLLLVMLAAALSACAPTAGIIVYSHGTVLAPLNPLLPNAQFRDDQSDVDAANDAKRDNENEQVRLTGARLERERKAAEAAHFGADPTTADDPAPGNPYADANLDRAAIMSALEVVRPRITACKVAGVSGQVLVLVKVGANGHIRSVHVERTPDPAVGACVAQQVSYATFAETTNGASFRYPVVF